MPETRIAEPAQDWKLSLWAECVRNTPIISAGFPFAQRYAKAIGVPHQLPKRRLLSSALKTIYFAALPSRLCNHDSSAGACRSFMSMQ